MKKLVLTRKNESDQGTFGRLAGKTLSLYTAELPWRDNKRKLSRIPTGVYQCAPYSSAKYPDVYQVLDVPDREAILIHAGNWSGDKLKGLRSDVEGCILVGMSTGMLQGQYAVLQSKDAVKYLRKWAEKDQFELEIIEEWT